MAGRPFLIIFGKSVFGAVHDLTLHWSTLGDIFNMVKRVNSRVASTGRVDPISSHRRVIETSYLKTYETLHGEGVNIYLGVYDFFGNYSHQ